MAAPASRLLALAGSCHRRPIPVLADDVHAAAANPGAAAMTLTA